MDDQKFETNSILGKIVDGFDRVEIIIAVVMSVVILAVSLATLVNIVRMGFELVSSIFNPDETILYSSYSMIFARMITLLIALEFMNSILKILKTRDIRVLAGDVVLITVLAICRKLIVLDYAAYAPLYFIGFALLICALGIVWFMLSDHMIFNSVRKEKAHRNS